jgi:hypothetical protein
MPYLEIKLGPDTLLLRFASRIDYVFGRLPLSDVQLRDMKVSRLHTQMFIDSKGFAWCRDLGSSSGTFVNGQRLSQKAVAPLLEGTAVRIGDAVVTFFEDDPPSFAVDPPGMSAPRGLVRTTQRERLQPRGAIPVRGKSEPMEDGPAEPPPEVKLEDFSGNPNDETNRHPATPKRRRDTGIVEAPWEKRDSGKVKPATKKPTVRVSRNPGSNPLAMPSAEFDEEGNFLEEKPAPSTRMGPNKKVPPIPVAGSGTGKKTSSAEMEAFRPPPPIQGEMPVDEEESGRAPKLPTVRLDRALMEERMRAQEDEASPSIPSVAGFNEQSDVVEDDVAVEPRIGMPPGTKSGEIISDKEFDSDIEIPDEEDLSDEEVVHKMGGDDGSVADVNFGDPNESQDEDDGEAVFGEASATLEGDEDIDIDSDSKRQPAVQVSSRHGVTPDSTFKPRKTRKLMKRRTRGLDQPDGDTPETHEEEMPVAGAKTVFVPRPGSADFGGFGDEDDETAQAERLGENIESKSLAELADGPGGNTVALPPKMVDELRADLPERAADAAEIKKKRPVGGKPTDILGDLEKLPPSKRAATPDEPDTLVE